MTENENIKESIRDWYLEGPQKEALWWEIFKRVRRHEVAFLGKNLPHRWYTLGKFDFFVSQLQDRFGEGNPWFNFFKSTEFVRFTNENNEPVDLKETWNTYGWSWYIDIDVDWKDTIEENIKLAKKECDKVKNYLDSKNCPYSLKFSGSKGFHIMVPWMYKKDGENKKYLAKYFEPEDYGDINKKLGSFIVDETDVNPKSVDTTVWGNSKDLIRVPYTLNPKSGLIALPLTDRQFSKFSLDIVEPEYVKDSLKLKNRGLKLHGDDLEEFISEFREHGDFKEYEKEKQREKRQMEERVDRMVRTYESLPQNYKKKFEKVIKRNKNAR